VDLVRIGEATAARFAFRAWVEAVRGVKPVAGTDSCRVRHVGVLQSGRLVVSHEDGSEVELGPSEAYPIEPGHDAAVIGNEWFVAFEFESRSAEEYARN
jgi:hypothetical protein